MSNLEKYQPVTILPFTQLPLLQAVLYSDAFGTGPGGMVQLSVNQKTQALSSTLFWVETSMDNADVDAPEWDVLSLVDLTITAVTVGAISGFSTPIGWWLVQMPNFTFSPTFSFSVAANSRIRFGALEKTTPLTPSTVRVRARLSSAV